MEELNKKLAEWAGFYLKDVQYGYDLEDATCYPPRKVWHYKGCIVELPSFPHSLDACFKWLVPKLHNQDINLRIEFQGLSVTIYGSNPRDDDYPTLQKAFAGAETPALALCKAIEKLIDSKEVTR